MRNKDENKKKIIKPSAHLLNKKELKEIVGGSCYLPNSTVPSHDMSDAACEDSGGVSSEW